MAEGTTRRGAVAELEAGKPADTGDVVLTRGGVTLRFLLGQRARVMRIIDFRAGPHPDKLSMVLEVAALHGMQRAFTLVEREEAGTWTRLGFEKEGVIPGFYKRSDAHVLGLRLDEVPGQSTVRIKVGVETPEDSERTYQAARRLLKGRDAGGAHEEPPRVKVAVARQQDEERALGIARHTGRLLTDLSPFGRDVERSSFLCTARGGFSLLVGVEVQPCFDNALIELVSAPRGEKELLMMAGALGQVCEALRERGIVSVFSLVPADSVELSAIFLAGGFRRSGLMRRQLARAGLGREPGVGRPIDAQIWARKLAEPG